jgi:hypothetical protein
MELVLDARAHIDMTGKQACQRVFERSEIQWEFMQGATSGWNFLFRIIPLRRSLPNTSRSKRSTLQKQSLSP